ncbi:MULTISPECIES: trypsin-like peptidase domain-containing protein [unclassified Paenibacillus]|uniref:S1C family serine protease n=1 Tax=unclassified Paenibacillus TaxID=185978 RepID=UPI001AEA53B0|nr:serine protease Do [Paenibacillus sp. PvP091]MBP1171326.1 serine protease Do [Paenibacillus sp. PvR098]MBP2442354.1 serine protease Do [Paenibacillus sp. PvP052]
MSLFDDDDFYSTKMSHKEALRLSAGRLPTRWPWLLPATVGAVVLAVLFLFFGGGSSDDMAQPQALAAFAPAPGMADVEDQSDREMSDTVVGAAERISPTVVSIFGTRREGDKERGGSMGLGSGVIFDRAGDKVRIVTNNHVVDGFTKLDIMTITGEKREAALVGSDQITDLAVLEIDGSGIKQVAEFGDSDALRAGETAIAVGNPLGLGYAPTVTKGIISWPKRTIPVSLGREGEFDWEMEVIQTDAAINQGNSGGALVNLAGKVVGINTMKVADMGVEGLGFAIPINQAKTVIQALVTDQKVKRPYIGVVTQDLHLFAEADNLKIPSDIKRGVIVLEVIGPAKEAGLRSGDVIVELDGKSVEGTLALRKYIYGHKRIGDELNVTFYRGAKKSTLPLKLEELQQER